MNTVAGGRNAWCIVTEMPAQQAPSQSRSRVLHGAGACIARNTSVWQDSVFEVKATAGDPHLGGEEPWNDSEGRDGIAQLPLALLFKNDYMSTPADPASGCQVMVLK